MPKLKENQIIVSYAEMLAAMLLYFKKVDPVDYALLANHMKKKLEESNPGYEIIVSDTLADIPDEFDLIRSSRWDDEYTSILGYHYDDEKGCYTSALELVSEEYKSLLEKVYSDEAVDALEDYNNPDGVARHYKEKEEKLKALRECLRDANMLQTLNVLLISQSEEEYKSLKSMGFKNINWFKSIRRAKEYFEVHPNELARHHIVLDAYESRSHIDKEAKEKFQKIVKKSAFLDTSTKSGTTPEGELICRLAESLLIRWPDGTLPELEYKEIVDCNNLVPFPRTERGLKILALVPQADEEGYKELATQKGLKITTCSDIYPGSQFSESRHQSFLKWACKNVGNYDIVIMPESVSNIDISADEIKEQCKKTGRQTVYTVRYTKNPDSGVITFKYLCSGIRMDPVSGEITFRIDNTDGKSENIIEAIVSAAMYEWNRLKDGGGLDNSEFGKSPNMVGTLPEAKKENISVVDEPPKPAVAPKIVEISKSEIEFRIERFDAAVRNVNTYIAHSSARNIWLDSEETASVLFEVGEYSTEVQYSRNGVPVFVVIFPKDEQQGSKRKFGYRRYNSKKRGFTGPISASYSLGPPPSGPAADDQKNIDIVVETINTGLYGINMERQEEIERERLRKEELRNRNQGRRRSRPYRWY